MSANNLKEIASKTGWTIEELNEAISPPSQIPKPKVNFQKRTALPVCSILKTAGPNRSRASLVPRYSPLSNLRNRDKPIPPTETKTTSEKKSVFIQAVPPLSEFETRKFHLQLIETATSKIVIKPVLPSWI